MYNHIKQYKQLGYQPISENCSGIGSEVLWNPAQGRVVKFGQDPAYDVFVTHASSFPSPQFPCFYLHQLPAGPFAVGSNIPYTVTEMEHLSPLTVSEEALVINWINAIFSALKGGMGPNQVPDPFDLTKTFMDLSRVARQNGVGLDVLKPSNYMVRATHNGRQIVFTDPYNSI